MESIDAESRSPETDECPVALVSACLLGVACRYDGEDAFRAAMTSVLKGYRVVPMCPEQLGGLPTPRPAAAIVPMPGTTPNALPTGEDVLDGRARVCRVHDGVDVTGEFLRGARAAVHIAQTVGATVAFLKDRSPSCAAAHLPFGDALRPGVGVTAALLRRQGLVVHAVD